MILLFAIILSHLLNFHLLFCRLYFVSCSFIVYSRYTRKINVTSSRKISVMENRIGARLYWKRLLKPALDYIVGCLRPNRPPRTNDAIARAVRMLKQKTAGSRRHPRRLEVLGQPADKWSYQQDVAGPVVASASTSTATASATRAGTPQKPKLKYLHGPWEEERTHWKFKRLDESRSTLKSMFHLKLINSSPIHAFRSLGIPISSLLHLFICRELKNRLNESPTVQQKSS